MARSLLIALLFSLSIANASGSGAVVPQHKTPPSSVAHNIPAGSHFSRNWSGYIVRHGDFTGVGATWQVPKIDTSASSDLSADATWVGVGGSSSDDLFQAGTQAIRENGDLVYQAWVELLPDYLQSIPLRVRSGDSVSVYLHETMPGLWTLQFTNNTTGATYEHTYTYDSSHSSAEWIEEMPMQANGTLIPLDYFGSVTFSGAFAETSDGAQTPGALNASPITLVDHGGYPMAVPSTLNDNTFSVARE